MRRAVAAPTAVASATTDEVVDGTVALGAFREPHGKQVEALGLGDGPVDGVLESDLAVGVGAVEFAVEDGVADVGHGGFGFDAERQAQAGVRVGVHGQDGPTGLLDEASDDQGGDGRLAASPFARDGDRCAHALMCFSFVPV